MASRFTRLGRFLWCLVAALPGAAKADAYPDLSTPSAMAAQGGRESAVIVAIDKYFALPPIAGALENAVAWQRFFVEGRRIPANRVALLKNEQATREGILEAVEDATAKVPPDGTLWVVFVGHGAPGRDQKDGILVAVDAQQSVRGLYSRSVAQRELVERVSEGKQAKTVMVLDACFSGRGSSGEAIVEGLQPVIVQRERSTSERVAVLTAAAGDQFAGPLPGVARPAFSYILLGAMRGWGDADRNGTVTVGEAMGYARQQLAVLPIGRAQTPDAVGGIEGWELSSGVGEDPPELVRIARAELEAKRTRAERARFTQQTWAWTSVGAGAALLATGGYFAYAARTDGDAFKAQCTPTNECPDSAQPTYQEARRESGLSIASFATGIAFGALGGYLLWTLPGAPPAVPTALRVDPTGFSIRGEF